jgi:hypothetical protein
VALVGNAPVLEGVLSRLAGAVMVSHAIYPAYDGENRPSTLSPPVIGGGSIMIIGAERSSAQYWIAMRVCVGVTTPRWLAADKSSERFGHNLC